MSNLAGLMQALAAWGKYPVPIELAFDLPIGDGAALLLLRDALAGPAWHEAAGLAGDPVPLGDPRWRACTPARRCPLRGEVAGLDTWWHDERGRAPRRLRGSITRERRGEERVYHQWIHLDGQPPYLRVPDESARDRARVLDGWRNDVQDMSSPARDATVGEWMASFSLWWVDGPGVHHTVVELEAEPGGLLLATLIVTGTSSPDELRDALVRDAWTLAGLTARTYWALWERHHTRQIDDAIPRVVDPSDARVTSPAEVFRCVTSLLDPIVLQIAGAMQSPSAGLFLASPSTDEIELVSHVGYRDPGQPQTFSYRVGLTRLFAWEVTPITVDLHGRRRAFQLADEETLRRAYRDLGISSDGTVSNSGDWVLDALRSSEKDGPWAWAHVPLDPGIWHGPSSRELRAVPHDALMRYGLRVRESTSGPAGVLKLSGRVRSELDGEQVPAFAVRELVALDRWARLVAAILQRVVTVYAEYVSRSLVIGAASHVCRSPKAFCEYVRNALAAKAVMLLTDADATGEHFAIVAEHWQPRVTDDVRERIRGIVAASSDGAPARSALSAPATRDSVETMVRYDEGQDAWNSHFRTIVIDGSVRGVLVVVGAPSNLDVDAGAIERSCSRSFSPMLRPVMGLLAALLAGRSEFARSTESAPGLGLRQAWHRLQRTIDPSTYKHLPATMQESITRLVSDLAASFKHQRELATTLVVEPQTVRRHLLSLTGRVGSKGAEASAAFEWRSLGLGGQATNVDELARRVDVLAREIARVRPRSSEPPAEPASRVSARRGGRS